MQKYQPRQPCLNFIKPTLGCLYAKKVTKHVEVGNSDTREGQIKKDAAVTTPEDEQQELR